MKEPKLPQPNAVQKLREEAKRIRDGLHPSEAMKKALEETRKKQEREANKKIAHSSDRHPDAEV